MAKNHILIELFCEIKRWHKSCIGLIPQTSNQNQREDTKLEIQNEIAGERQSVIKRVLGCWHLKLSYPKTTNNITYCYCINCGMRRKYDLETFKAKGSFYNPPISNDIYFV
jgi:hypothetical protein